MNRVIVPLNLTLHANQRIVHASDARFKVIRAGKRFGKTYWALFELLQRAGMVRNGTFWYIAQTYGQAESTAWGVLHEMLPHQYIEAEWQTKLRIKLKVNGSIIELKGADNPDTLRGTALHGAVFDEYAYHPGETWPRIIRGQLANTKGFASFISSPHAKGRNHFTTFCDETKRRMLAGDKDHAYFHFTIYDNPTIERQEIEDIRASVSDDVWQTEYMAEESNLGGSIFGEFNRADNVQDLDAESFDYSVLAMDYGLNHPSANLWIDVNTQKKIIYFRDELVKSGSTFDEVCRLIKAKSGERVPFVGVLDPSAARRDPFTKRSYIDEYRRCFREFGGEWENMGVVPGDNKDRGYEVLKMLLKKKVVKVHPRCRNLIYQLENVTYEDTTGEDATDAARYGTTYIHDRVQGMNILPNLEEKEPVTTLPAGVYSAKSALFSQTRAPLNWAMNEYA